MEFYQYTRRITWKEDIWFDDVRIFHNGFARVYIEGKGWNFINTNGELLWKKDKWFYESWDFKTDCPYNKVITKCALVRIEQTIQYLLTNGEILQYNSYNNNNNFIGFKQWTM